MRAHWNVKDFHLDFWSPGGACGRREVRLFDLLEVERQLVQIGVYVVCRDVAAATSAKLRMPNRATGQPISRLRYRAARQPVTAAWRHLKDAKAGCSEIGQRGHWSARDLIKEIAWSFCGRFGLCCPVCCPPVRA